MFNSKGYLFAMAILMLLLIPMSFAADADNNMTGIDDYQIGSDIEESVSDFDDDYTEENLEYSSNFLSSSNIDELSSPDYDYETTINNPRGGVVDYSLGGDDVISVTTTYDYTSMKELGNSKMFAFINGNTTGVVVKSTWNTDVYGNALSFSFNLNQFDEYLTQSRNTIVFHPDEAYYQWCYPPITTYNYEPLVVNVVDRPSADVVTKYYVDGTVTVDGDGSEGSVYSTISAAINAASENFKDKGGNIIIRSGVYTVSSTISISKNITISSTEGAVITSSGSGSLFSQTSKANVKLSGLTFENISITSGAIFYQNGISVDGSTLNIEECNFIANEAPNLIRIYKTKTTIKQVNFIKNVITSDSDSRGGLINVYSGGGSMYGASPYTFDISYSNIVENTLANNYIFTSVEPWQGLTANNNYWGLNFTSKPTNIYNKESTKDADGNCLLTLDNWAVLSSSISDIIYNGQSYNYNLRFIGNDGSSLSEYLPDLKVDVTANGTLNRNSVTISNNLAILTYTAPDLENDVISVKYENNELTYKNITIVVADPVYISSTSPEIVDYTLGDSSIITVSVSYPSEFKDDFEFFSMFVYINGEDMSDRVVINNIKASATSFDFDLAAISDKLVVGSNVLTFHPHIGALEGTVTGDYVFNPLIVNVANNTVVVPDVSYVTTPVPDVVDYVLGESSVITVNVDYDDSFMSRLSGFKVFVYINGEAVSDRVVIPDVKGSDSSFEFDLASISDKLVVGSNVLTFHMNSGALDDIFDGSYTFNELTVNVVNNTVVVPDVSYVTTPVPDVVDYVLGESSVITVNVDYDDSFMSRLSGFKVFVYINGEDISDRVVIPDVKGSDSSFEFDLASISDKLVVGSNVLTFHMNSGALDDIFDGSYTFNPLTVNVSSSPAVIKYESTPEIGSIEYAKGEDKEVTINVDCDNLDYYFEYCVLYAYINGSSNGIRLNGVMADTNPAIVNLKLLDNYFEVGETYSIVFHPENSDFGQWGGPKLSEAKFNPLLVTVTEGSNLPLEPVYTITANPTEVSEYINGTNYVISVVANYDSSKPYLFENRAMYIYINGEEVIVSNVKAYNKSFTIDLINYTEKLVEGVNNISIHPQLLALQTIFQTVEDVFVFNNISVNVVNAEIPVVKPLYNSSTEVTVIDYVLGDEGIISVDVDFDESFASDLGKLPVFVYINGASEGIAIPGVKGNDSSFEFDLASISDKLVVGSNVLTFHPSISDLKDISDGEVISAELTVNVENVTEVNPDTYYITTPVPDEVDYVLGESSVVVVNVDYDSYFNDNLTSFKMFVYINGEAISNRVVIPGVMSNVASFEFDLATISDKLVVGSNILTFHPNVGALQDTLAGPYTFNPLTVNVNESVEPVEEINYTVSSGLNESDYVIGDSSVVCVNVDYVESFADVLSQLPMFVYINDGEGVEISGVSAADSSFNFDLSDISGYLVVGVNVISIHPDIGELSKIGNVNYKFNNFTVNVKESVEPVEEINYTVSPSPDTLDYVIGDSSVVCVNVDYVESFADVLSQLPMFVYINDGEGVEISGVSAADSSFNFDLSDISGYLVVGVNVISIHPDIDELSKIGNVSYTFNNLTVNADNAPINPDTTYITTPNPSKVDYKEGSCKITVTVNYDDYFNKDLALYSMFVYINGEDISNRVVIPGVKGNFTSFEFDLASISDKLVVGSNVLTFHPHIGALEGTFVGPYTFNPLTVNYGEDPSPINQSTNDTLITPAINVTANNITEGEIAIINVEVPENATGEVYLEILNKTLHSKINDGNAIFNIENLTVGNYSAVVRYSGDGNYSNASVLVDFTVDAKAEPVPEPVVPNVVVSVEPIVEGEVAVIDVVIDDATGGVVVEVDGDKYYADLVDGKASINVPGLVTGNYSAVVRYSGDGNYSNASVLVDFTVDAKVEPVPEPVSPSLNVTIENKIYVGDPAIAKIDLPTDASGNVTVKVDGVVIANVCLINGSAKVSLPSLNEGTHNVEVEFQGDSKYLSKTSLTHVVANKRSTYIEVGKSFTRLATDYFAGEKGAYYTAYLKDQDGNPVAGKNVFITVNGVVYKVTTTKNGAIKLRINLNKAKTYSYSLKFNGDDTYKGSAGLSKLTITKKKTSISASKKTFKAKAKTKIIQVKLKTVKNPYNGKTYLKKGKKLTLRINKKTYTGKTNSKGIVKFKIKLTKKGKYTAKIKFAGDKTYKACSKSIKVTIKK